MEELSNEIIQNLINANQVAIRQLGNDIMELKKEVEKIKKGDPDAKGKKKT